MSPSQHERLRLWLCEIWQLHNIDIHFYTFYCHLILNVTNQAIICYVIYNNHAHEHKCWIYKQSFSVLFNKSLITVVTSPVKVFTHCIDVDERWSWQTNGKVKLHPLFPKVNLQKVWLCTVTFLWKHVAPTWQVVLLSSFSVFRGIFFFLFFVVFCFCYCLSCTTRGSNIVTSLPSISWVTT